MASRAIKGRYNVKKKTGKAVGIAIVSVILATIVAFGIGGVALAKSWLEDLPDYSNSNALNTSATSVVYASDGKTVLAEFQLENRTPVELDQISQFVKDGTVATEDERFYKHEGVDLMGTARAVVNNILGGSREGGSTITQQLVRNTILSEEMNEISIKRKLREMFIATEVEKNYSKDEILLMYLNTINYGAGAYGIEAAAERYFSKHATELTLSEAATLVGIPQSPTYNSPIDHPDNATKRRNTVLDRMVTNGYLSQADADAAKAEEIVLNTTKPSVTGIKAYPYFASYVRNQLLNQDGRYALSSAELFGGGFQIITTLDIDDQKAADEVATKKAKQAGSAYEVAMAAIDPDNGHIKAMVGGKDYETSQVNMATGEGGSGRQVGSSFKTFTLCAAIEAGIDPKTAIDAGYSVELEGTDHVVYNVNKASYGSVPIKRAFEVSSNTAFTRLLLSVGVDKVREMAQRLGIKAPIQDSAGITLGIDSIPPLEMASAYATIANGGTRYEPECILQIKDRDGNVVVDNSNPEGERVISEEVAGAVIEVMDGVIKNGSGTAARLSIGQPAVGKTGTTEERKDSWFVGFTPQLSVAFWLGNRADTYEEALTVPITVASAFGDFLDIVLKDVEKEDFFKADDPPYQKRYIDEKNHIGKGNWHATEDPNKEASSSSSSSASSSSGSSGGHASSGGSGGNQGGNHGGGGSSGNTSSSGSSSGNEGGGNEGGTTPQPENPAAVNEP